MHDLTLQQLLNVTYAYLIRNIDTHENRIKFDKMIGLIESDGEDDDDFFEGGKGDDPLKVTDIGVAMMDAFMNEYGAQKDAQEARTMDDMPTVTEDSP